MPEHLGESHVHLKDGQMSVAKHADYDPPASKLGPRTAAVPPRQSKRLHRMLPALPVHLGADPAGSTVTLQRWQDDQRDWRRLPNPDIARAFAGLAPVQPHVNRLYPEHLRRSPEERKNLEGLVAAIAVGTLQACREREYWAPSADDPAAARVQVVRAPVSRAFVAMPDLSKLPARSEGPQEVSVDAERGCLEVCHSISSEPDLPRVGLVRFVAAGDPRSSSVLIGSDFREAFMTLRTSFAEALQEMPRQLHADPARLLDSGAVLSTSDVAILRGPLDLGAPWLREPSRIEVFTVALPRHPRCDDQQQYARIGEKAQTAEAIDRAFGVAAERGIDVLVVPPPGVGGVAGCHHPAADAGDLLRKAILAHAAHFQRVVVCREHAAQMRHGACWAQFAAAVERGRAPLEHRGLVPVAASPYVRPGWAATAPPGLLAAISRHVRGPATPRGASAAALGAAGRAIAC